MQLFCNNCLCFIIFVALIGNTSALASNFLIQSKQKRVIPSSIKPLKASKSDTKQKVKDKNKNSANTLKTKAEPKSGSKKDKAKVKSKPKVKKSTSFSKEISNSLAIAKQNLIADTVSSRDSVKSFFDQMGRKLNWNSWGISMLFSGKNATNSDVDLVFAGVDYFSQKSFNVSGSISYFFKDNMSLGLSVTYQQDNYKLRANILQNFLSRDIQNISRKFSINPFIKNYVPLSSRNIIYITNQTELMYELENGIYNTPVNRDPGSSIPIPGQDPPAQVLQNKASRIQLLGFGIRPGVLVFFSPHFAFESTIGIFSFAYKTEQLVYNYPKGEPDKTMRKENITNTSLGFDFKLNILKFGFGFSYYF